MTTDESSHETWSTVFRKRIRKISGLATEVGKVIWRPQPGRQFALSRAYAKVRTQVGTNSDAPNINVSNGTTNTIAGVDLLVAQGAVQRLTVTGNVIFDYDNPLTLVVSDAGAGSTTLDYDLILFADKITA